MFPRIKDEPFKKEEKFVDIVKMMVNIEEE